MNLPGSWVLNTAHLSIQIFLVGELRKCTLKSNAAPVLPFPSLGFWLSCCFETEPLRWTITLSCAESPRPPLLFSQALLTSLGICSGNTLPGRGIWCFELIGSTTQYQVKTQEAHVLSLTAKNRTYHQPSSANPQRQTAGRPSLMICWSFSLMARARYPLFQHWPDAVAPIQRVPDVENMENLKNIFKKTSVNVVMVLSTLKISVLYQWNPFLRILIFGQSLCYTWNKQPGLKNQKLRNFMVYINCYNAIHNPYYSRLVPGGTKDPNLGEPHFFSRGPTYGPPNSRICWDPDHTASPENKICGPNPPKPPSQGIVSKIS